MGFTRTTNLYGHGTNQPSWVSQKAIRHNIFKSMTFINDRNMHRLPTSHIWIWLSSLTSDSNGHLIKIETTYSLHHHTMQWGESRSPILHHKSNERLTCFVRLKFSKLCLRTRHLPCVARGHRRADQASPTLTTLTRLHITLLPSTKLLKPDTNSRHPRTAPPYQHCCKPKTGTTIPPWLYCLLVFTALHGSFGYMTSEAF